ncbi:4-hydroxy-tetrahydrodipicolinate synthase [Seminavis robusta]|uniref:4-hydroxy-tetrahydrodipicolinate synthase n=1 Tax=Seminavis robusta TaxID=568900 RepID=A0A9N8HJI2_9STRA|nr:4-hydroxy-tetrahydrodipicolinate synthase [Seminavis robusta]|eukprot:Sro862_g212470.1 4-hydroxy-tetrahydrodipicolinate synthase (355) ;mRNA; f:25596-27360
MWAVVANGLQPVHNNLQANGHANGQTNGHATPANGVAASNANELFPMRRGSAVALVTPMKPVTGEIDLPALEQLLEWHIESGTDNLCILGTTGEANTLTMKEREAILKTAVKVCKGRIPILAGCGTIDPAHVKEMTMQAMDLGVDASLVVTPYYVKPPQRGLIQHFTNAADLGLPVVVYNVPGRTGVDLLDESMALLAQHDTIVGLKDATGDLSRLTNLKQELDKSNAENNNDILIYSGDDGTSKDFAVLGGDGSISVTANVAPTAIHKMLQAAFAGDDELATEINEPIKALHNDLFVEANPIPAKWAVYRQGRIPSPICRPPLAELDEKWHKPLERLLQEAGVLETTKDVHAP